MTTLITGATDGIGLELARIYQDRGDRLVLIGRRAPPDLQDDLFTPETYCRIDLARGDSAEIETFLSSQRISGIDRLILNAGTGYYGPTRAQSAESIRSTVAVNLSSTVSLIHHCWPQLKAAGGQVILVGSVIAALPCPDYSVYGATKAAVDGFARSLRYELGPDVGVRVIHPGATRTGLHEKIGVDQDRIDWTRFPSAESVATSIARKVDESRGWRSFPGLGEAWIWRIGRRLPRLIDRSVGRT